VARLLCVWLCCGDEASGVVSTKPACNGCQNPMCPTVSLYCRWCRLAILPYFMYVFVCELTMADCSKCFNSIACSTCGEPAATHCGQGWLTCMHLAWLGWR
jgi:hypothetical protein